MTKKKTEFECSKCSYKTGKWMGQCPDCGHWNSFVEIEKVSAVKQAKKSPISSGSEPVAVTNVRVEASERIKTGVAEFDRVIGGGITYGSLNLIGGEPGVGKSTLLLEICGKVAKLFPGEKVLYASGEESESQIADRARRLGVDTDNLLVHHETSWQDILAQIKAVRPKLFVLDSIQTTISQELNSPSGTVSQIREVTYELMNYAKAYNMPTFIIGHVTKDGNLSGPKILEHMVDTVLYFEGDQENYYRVLRTMKNRFGNTYEVGIFEMSEEGLNEVRNPSQYFIDNSFEDAYGRSITCLTEGSRTLFVEVQALVTENKYGNGRRTTQGIDQNRLSMLVAIIEKYFEIPLGFHDIYVNIVGGLKVNNRDADLSIIAAILSSYYSKPLDEKTVFLGEVGLTGEVRKSKMLTPKVNEMEALEYRQLVTGKLTDNISNKKFTVGIKEIQKVIDLKEILFLGPNSVDPKIINDSEIQSDHLDF